MVLENYSFSDSLYMTIITITTVGFAEVVPLSTSGKYFTIGLILIGVSFILYLFNKVTETVVEGGLKTILGRINMEKNIKNMSGHYIICGFGRIGREICKTLKENKRPLVVIENNQETLKEVDKLGYFALSGDASRDETLLKAGIERANGLIAVVSSDADNVYITLSARGLKQNLFILSRASSEEGAETKLLRAGADKVISPYYIGAKRMAELIIRPTVVDFLDLTMHTDDLDLSLDEFLIPPDSRLNNVSLMDSGLRQKYDLIVVAIKRKKKEMIFNPSPTTAIQEGDILIVLGKYAQINALENNL
jgi:voltage-gated potassium channel